MGCQCTGMGITVKMSFQIKEKASRKLANGQILIILKKKMAQGLHLPKYHNIQTCLLVYAADLR